MPSLRLTMPLALCLLGTFVLAGLGGCCCPPMSEDACLSGHGGGHGGHHGRVLRKNTLPPLVPAPAVAAPIPRYHPLPTHPVFEPQADYSPLASLSHDPALLAPELLPHASGEPTPAPLPPAPGK
jgi:hypothetical protein